MSAQPLEIRMARLEGGFEQIDKRLAQVDTTLGRLDERVGRLEVRLDQKADSLQWRLTSLIVATWVTTMLTILFKH